MSTILSVGLKNAINSPSLMACGRVGGCVVQRETASAAGCGGLRLAVARREVWHTLMIFSVQSSSLAMAGDVSKHEAIDPFGDSRTVSAASRPPYDWPHT